MLWHTRGTKCPCISMILVGVLQLASWFKVPCTFDFTCWWFLCLDTCPVLLSLHKAGRHLCSGKWQSCTFHFPQAALRWAKKMNEEVGRVFRKKWEGLRKAGGGRQQEPNGIEECSLGERKERLRHSSSIAALRFLFARYYGLAECIS